MSSTDKQPTTTHRGKALKERNKTREAQRARQKAAKQAVEDRKKNEQNHYLQTQRDMRAAVYARRGMDPPP